MSTHDNRRTDAVTDPAEWIEADQRLRERSRNRAERGAWPMREDWHHNLTPEDN